MKIDNNQQKGFTLIELLIFLGLFSVILMVLTNLFTAIIETQIDTQAISSTESDSKFITSRLIYDIQRAQSITTPTSLGEQTTSLTLVIDGTVYVYSLYNGNLRLTVGADVNNLNSEGSTINNMTFTRLGNTGGKHAIQVNYTISSTQPQASGPETKTINTLIGLR